VLIRGTVRDQAGAAVEAARVLLVDGPGPFPDLAALTDSQGRFTLSVATAGRYVVQCHAEGFEPASAGATASPLAEIPVEIQLNLV
jgi:hypothetical protein